MPATLEELELQLNEIASTVATLQETAISGEGEIFNHGKRLDVDISTRLSDLVGSDTNHTHTKLVPSDGTPDPAISTDDDGNIIISNFVIAGYVKNNEFGILSGGNTVDSGDITGLEEDQILFADVNGLIEQSSTFVNVAGKIGIGYSSPSRMLSINGRIGLEKHLIFESDDDYSNQQTQFIYHNPIYNLAGARTEVARITMLRPSVADGNYDGEIAFSTRLTGNALAEAMRIDKNGNVGIGVASPATLLHLKKDQGDAGTKITVTNDTGGVAAFAAIQCLSNSCAGLFGAYDDGHANAEYADKTCLFAGSGSAALAFFATEATGKQQFYTGGTASGNLRMTISSAGNVGIGAEPDPTIRLYSVAPDDQDAIFVSVYGLTLSDAANNFSIYGNSLGGGGTTNTALYGNAANAITNNYALYTYDGDVLLNVNSGYLVLPKASGKGIKVDSSTPTFGWRDLKGDVTVKTAGANDPDFNDYHSGIHRYQFKNTGMTEIFNDYHFDHDNVPAAEVYIHIHWSQTNRDTGGAGGIPGNAKWYFAANYAKGHNQAAFPAGATTVSVVETASINARQHMISEVQLSTNSQIAGQDIEPDGILTVRTYRDPADPADTLNQRPWVHHVDIHYQSTNIATKQKVPDFYN